MRRASVKAHADLGTGHSIVMMGVYCGAARPTTGPWGGRVGACARWRPPRMARSAPPGVVVARSGPARHALRRISPSTARPILVTISGIASTSDSAVWKFTMQARSR